MYLLPRRSIAKSDAKSSTLFVGRGIGITGLPVRINCPPQIAHLTLKKA
jgi:predicted MPP superfamily phosphohydrolase